jgi:hypothetical protein
MTEDIRGTNNWFYTIRPKVYRRDNGRCYASSKGVGKTPGDWTCHHVRPVELGGSHDLDNLVCLCLKCHRFVHTEYIRYKRRLKRRVYFIRVDGAGHRVVRWLNYCLVARHRRTNNPRLRRLYKLANGIP